MEKHLKMCLPCSQRNVDVLLGVSKTINVPGLWIRSIGVLTVE